MRQVRRNLFIIISALLCIGTTMIYSSSAIYANEKFGESGFFLKRHLIYLVVGLMSALGVMSFDYTRIRKYSRHILFLAFALLLTVLLFGWETGGARRWFKFWFLSFQPSEFAKLALTIYLADFLARKQTRIREFIYGFLPAGSITAIMALLILAQPDLGTAVAILLLGFMMFFASGIRVKHLVSTVLACVPVLFLAIACAPYRRRRILAFVDPWGDPQGTGFQIIQSFLALGSGGLFGVGLGQSQQKLFYLPAAQTDFIFSIIGEELGFIGAVTVLSLFALFLWQGLKISFAAKDLFGKFLSLGITSLVTIQVVINVGASTGSIPTKGLPLPFISYGGSSLVFNLIAVGMLLNVAKHSQGSEVHT